MLTKIAEELMSEYTQQGACEVAVPVTLPGTPTDNVATASNGAVTREASNVDFAPEGCDTCCDDSSDYGNGFREGFRTAFEMFHPETVVKEASCDCGTDCCGTPLCYTGDDPVVVRKSVDDPEKTEEKKAPTDGPMGMVTTDDAECKLAELNKEALAFLAPLAGMAGRIAAPLLGRGVAGAMGKGVFGAATKAMSGGTGMGVSLAADAAKALTQKMARPSGMPKQGQPSPTTYI